MALFNQDPLFMGGYGSNDPIVPNTGADLGASGTQRETAAQTVSSTSQSPEAAEQAHKELEETLRLIQANDRLKTKEQERAAALERANKAVKAAKEDRERDLRMLAREAGAWDSKRGFIILDEDGNQHFMNPKEYADALKRGDDEKKKLAESFEKQVAARLTDKSGLRGGAPGTPGAVSPGFRIHDVIGALSTGNFGGLARELFQPLGGTKAGEWKTLMGERGAAMAGRGSEMGGIGGLMRGLGGRAMGMLPMLATPAALLGAQQLVSRVTAASQATIREGQITGGGFREGLAARGETLRLAANPFDMLDRRTAQQIVSGLRSRGFTGELGRALQDTVGDVFQDLGTDIESTMEMVTEVVKNNVMTLSEFRDTMRDLDVQAKATGLSVKAVQENLKGIMETAGAAGGAQAMGAAAQVSPALQSIFAGTALARQGQLATFTEPVLRTAATMFGGVPTMFAGSAEVQRERGKFMDMYTNYLWNMMRQMPEPFNDINGLAMFLANSPMGQTFMPGVTGVDQIEMFLKALFKTRATGGFQKSIATSRAAAAKSAADARQKAEKTPQVGFSQVTGPASGATMLFNAVRNKLGMGGTTQGSMKSALEKLRGDMEDVGVAPDRIDAILGSARKAAFRKDIPTSVRTDLWEPAWAEATKEAVQEIKVVLAPTPEFSRYAQAQNATRTAYIAGGKNSQYTLPLPHVR